MEIPYLDEVVPFPKEFDYRPWLSELRDEGFSRLSASGDALVAQLAQQAVQALGPMLGISTAAAGPVGGVIAAGSAVLSIFAGLFGGNDNPIRVKPVAGFPAAVMQTNPLRDVNTAVAAGKVISGKFEKRGLVKDRVKSSSLNTLNEALRAYEGAAGGSAGWNAIEDRIGRYSSRRAVALFLAATNYEWLLGQGLLSSPLRRECFGRLMAYGAPRLQVRQVAFYQRIAMIRDVDEVGGVWGGHGVDRLRAIADSGGHIAFAGAAQMLAVPVPAQRGPLWTFNALRPEVVDAELRYYREHKLEESVGGQLFSFDDIGARHIEGAIAGAKFNRPYLNRVEDQLQRMADARKGLLRKQSGSSASMQKKRDRKAVDSSSTAPLVAGAVALGLGGLWLWKKRR